MTNFDSSGYTFIPVDKDDTKFLGSRELQVVDTYDIYRINVVNTKIKQLSSVQFQIKPTQASSTANAFLRITFPPTVILMTQLDC